MKIGILFSLTGTTGITERGQYQASLLAIHQINQAGGIHGKKLIPVVEDIKSDPYLAAHKMEKLIVHDQVTAIVGVYTSACRKMVLPVLEKYNKLLFYPTVYEGMEQHRNVVYCGPLPNQQLFHFIPWIIEHLGKSFYMIGSDYIFPRETHRYVKLLIQQCGGKFLGETFVPLGFQKFQTHLREIRDLKPDVIFSTLVGDSAGEFYLQHSRLGLKPPIATSISAETELASTSHVPAGLYSSSPYFSTVNTYKNRIFVSDYRNTYGTDIISSSMENAYNAVFLLAEALKKAKDFSTDAIRRVLPGLTFEAPQGTIRIDDKNQHLWLNSRIARYKGEGRFEVVWESESMLPPVPFVEIRSTAVHMGSMPDQCDEDELERRLAEHELILKELKDAVRPFPYTFAYFDADGVLLDVFEGLSAARPSIDKYLRIGSNLWTQYPLNKTGIGLALTGHTLSRVDPEQHDIPELKDWISAGLPVTSKSESVPIGVLGVFIEKGVEWESTIPLLLKSFSVITGLCAELQSRHHSNYSLSKMFREVTGHLSRALFVLHNGKILFHNTHAQDLLTKKRDFVHSTLAEIADARETNAIIRKENSDSLYEVQTLESAGYRYVYFKQLAQRNVVSRRNKSQLTTKDLVGKDPLFLKTVSLAVSAAKTTANVLLLGESGTGKEMFARAIHNESSRKDKPFIAINCAAIPKELIAAELFGYADGAFTGAKKGGSPGKFEAANGGTLFLDEIGDMPFELQAALLRVLQEKEVVPVGAHRPIPVDVRIIAATNKNLMQEIAYSGSFRSDLYYRLNVFTIELPPLRQRIGDLPELAAHYIRQLSMETGEPEISIAPEAMDIMMGYSWPGNIRELNNVLERAFYLAATDLSNMITADHLPQYMTQQSPKPNGQEEQTDPAETIRDMNAPHGIRLPGGDKERFIQTLLNRNGNISQAAKDLGISRTTLYKKMKEYNIQIKR